MAQPPIEMKLSTNKNIEQVCVVGNGLPQPMFLITLSERGYFKEKLDLISNLSDTLQIVNLKLDSHERFID